MLLAEGSKGAERTLVGPGEVMWSLALVGCDPVTDPFRPIAVALMKDFILH